MIQKLTKLGRILFSFGLAAAAALSSLLFLFLLPFVPHNEQIPFLTFLLHSRTIHYVTKV